MIKINYYNQIKETLVKNEIYKKVKDYSKNKSDLNAYFEVGRLIVEAQGGEKRAKYGNKLIKEYSEKLTNELGKGFTVSNLRKMRQFYLLFRKRSTLSSELTWSHYTELLKIKNINEVKYYIYITDKQNLSVRELREKIKFNEYERIGYKEELEEPKINTFIKNPIIIKVGDKKEKLSEYALHQSILENIDDFLKELGIGFTYVGSEVKIKMGDTYNYIDFLFFNTNYNCYVVIELKVTEMKAEYIGQITKYINYVDKNIKELFNDKTVGVIICKKENKFVMEYCTNPKIFTTTYKTS
ncbi:putative uncharacterized protein [Firmicutes bacterium CAG:822]|nr:putative uncharacterized protein [Firmicutes bacterium CAG:822]